MQPKMYVWGIVTLAPLMGLTTPPEPLSAMEITIVYLIRDVPGDPQSAVTLSVGIHLTQLDVVDGVALWRPDWMNFTRYDEAGQAIETYFDPNPAFLTLDGLWPVEHIDPDQPRREEFIRPPAIQGQADPASPEGEPLDYYLEAAELQGQPTWIPYAVTATLDYSFVGSMEEGPIEGEGEPVESPDGDEEPLWVAGT